MKEANDQLNSVEGNADNKPFPGLRRGALKGWFRTKRARIIPRIGIRRQRTELWVMDVHIDLLLDSVSISMPVKKRENKKSEVMKVVE